MNTYDANHLRLLSLIDAQRWSEIGHDDAYEINVLIVCKYVALTGAAGRAALIELNPEGHHYRRRLSQLSQRKVDQQA